MRSALAAAALFLIAPVVVAFDSFEHIAVSNAALKQARPAAPEGMKLAVETLLIEGQTFGDLTSIVDWFQEPERFPVSGDWAAIKRRHSTFFKRGLAIHRNSNHFQLSAAERYAWLHEEAISEAAAHRAPEALWYEALALHFLQDFFAPGHIVTPRKGSHDVVSAALHDSFNDLGLNVKIDMPGLPKVLPFKGDGQMSPEQRDFLVAVSARSIEDVFRAYESSKAVAPSLQLCFWSRVAKRAVKYDSPDPKGFEGPYAALRNPLTEGEACRCEENVIARYEIENITGKDLGDVYQLPFRAFKAGAYAVPARGGGRVVIDAGTFMQAWDPANSIRRADDPCCRDTYSNSLSGAFLVSATGIIGDRYRAFGVAVEPNQALIDQPIHVARWIEDIYIAGYLARRRYWHEGQHNTVFDVGAKLSIGFNVANVVIAAERGHRVSPRDDFEHKMFYMLGGEFVFSRSWFGLLKPKR